MSPGLMHGTGGALARASMDPIMGRGIQGVFVLAAFPAVHERLIEILRGIGSRWAGIDKLTIGHWNILPALILALLTQADFLALFQDVGGHSFFDLYLSGLDTLREMQAKDALLRHVIGC